MRNAPGRDSDGRHVDEYGLIPQHAKFVKYYMLRHNATWAAKMADYSPASCHVQGCKLLKHPKVAARLAQLNAEQDAKYANTDENIIRILCALAGFDARDIYNDDGTAKPVSDLDHAAGLAIVGIESSEMEVGGGEDGEPTSVIKVKKYRTAGRERALELLMKHRGMLDSKGSDKKDRLHEIVEAMRRSAYGEPPDVVSSKPDE